MKLATYYQRARTVARAIRSLPDTLERVQVLEDFVVAFGDDLDQFEKRLEEAVALAQDMHRGAEPEELVP